MHALRRLLGLMLVLNFLGIPLATILGSHINTYMSVVDVHPVWQVFAAFILLPAWLGATAYQGSRLLQNKPQRYPYGAFLFLLGYLPAVTFLFGGIPRIDFSSNDLSAYLTAYTFWIIPIVQFYDIFVVAPHHKPRLAAQKA